MRWIVTASFDRQFKWTLLSNKFRRLQASLMQLNVLLVIMVAIEVIFIGACGFQRVTGSRYLYI